MATIKVVSSHASIGRAIKYVTQETKIEYQEIEIPDDSLMSGINCVADNAMNQMMLTKRLWNKTDGRTYKHFTQNFAPGESTPEAVHRIGMELAGRMKPWEGFEVLVVTHTDKDYWHNHFIVNSVNIWDGHKLQWKKSDLTEMKQINDELCQAHGLSVPVKGKTFDGKVRTEATTYSRAFYENFLKENPEGKDTDSYIFNIAVAAMQVRAVATSREDFIEKMEEKNIGVTWEENRKYITFTDLSREDSNKKKCKVRNKKLEQYFHVPFGKEDLENGFNENRCRELKEYSIAEGTASRAERAEKAGSGKQPSEGSIDRVEREVREVSDKVKSIASGKREKKESRFTDPGRKDHPDSQRSAGNPDSQRVAERLLRKKHREPER